MAAVQMVQQQFFHNTGSGSGKKLAERHTITPDGFLKIESISGGPSLGNDFIKQRNLSEYQ